VVKSLERCSDSTISEPFEMGQAVLLPHPLDDLPIGAVDTKEDERVDRRRILHAPTRHRRAGQRYDHDSQQRSTTTGSGAEC